MSGLISAKSLQSHADVARELLLQRAQRALAGGGGALGVDHDRADPARQQPVAFRRAARRSIGLDGSADRLAPEALQARSVASRTMSSRVPQGAAVRGEQCRQHPRQRPMREPLQRIGCAYARRSHSAICAGPQRARVRIAATRRDAGTPSKRAARAGRSAAATDWRECRHDGARARPRRRPLTRPRACSNACDGVHLRNEIMRENAARDAAKIDAQIPDARSVRHREVRGDPDQQFVQSESLGPKYDQFAQVRSRSGRAAPRRRRARIDVFGPKDRRERQPILRDLRQQPGIPGPSVLVR